MAAVHRHAGAPTAVTISNTASINTMEFTPLAAPAYTFTVTNGASFTVNTGIRYQGLLPAFSFPRMS